ncbi:MAG: PAS domain S-box protein [Nitrospirota bacterium]|nr:PAS domain S-box protein [Nitrospirota bacterium]
MGDQRPRAAAAGESFAPGGQPVPSPVPYAALPAAALTALFAQAPSPVAVLDAGLHFISVNPAFAALYGMPVERFPGVPCGDLFRDDPLTRWLALTRDAGRPQLHSGSRLRCAASGEERVVDWTAVPASEAETGGPPMLLFGMDVTDRVRALAAEQERTAALLRSQSELSGILNNMQDTVYRSRLSGEVVWISPSVEQLLGYTPEELIGTDAANFYEDHAMRAELLEALRRQGGRIRSFQTAMVHRDGSRVWVHLNAKYFFDPGGRVAGIEGSLHDVTGLYRAHDQLARSERELSGILDNMQDTYYRTGTDGTLKRVSPSVAHLLGFSPRELVGCTLDSLYVDAAGAGHFLQTLRGNGGRVREFVLPLRHRQGHTVWVSTSAQYYVGGDGRIAGVEGTARDVTETRRMAEALRESESRLAETQAIARLGSWEWDVATGHLSGSGETRRLFGQSADGDGWTLEAFLECVHPQDRGRVSNDLHRAVQSDMPYEATFRLNGPEGEERTVRHLGLVEGRAGNARRMVGAVQDVTELARAQDERERFQSQLLQAQKMEAVGILAGGVAHDFNNLLTTIGGFTELVLGRTDPADPRYQDLDEVRMATTRAAALTRQLLLFSRKQPLHMQPLDINRRIEGLHTMLSRLIGEDIAIVIDPATTLWPVRGDGASIEQLVMNLSINARDAMPHGGRLTITTGMETVSPDQTARHPDAWAGQFVHITVADTGVGMDAETLASIFDPFFTTKELGKGTGLGMSVVHGIVRQHRGWIEVDSAPGRGTTFRVFVPAEDAPVAEDENRERDGVPAGGGGARVLLVEDEPSLRAFAEVALNQSGYQVVPCATVAEARAALSRVPAEFDLVFSDVVLPDGNGIQFAEWLKETRPELPILLCSGYPDQRSGWVALEARGVPFIQKPYTLGKLLNAVRGQLRA